MIKLVFIKKEDKKGIFKHPQRTNYFLPKRGRMVTLSKNNNRLAYIQYRKRYLQSFAPAHTVKQMRPNSTMCRQYEFYEACARWPQRANYMRYNVGAYI